MKTFSRLLTIGAFSLSILGVATGAQAQFYPGPMPMPMPPQSMPMPVPQSGPILPGYGLLPQDGMIVAEIAQTCGGNPMCMAGAWGRVEVQRCRNGFGVSGGCFGPNGEIMKVINSVVPQHLQPNVLIHNMANDIKNGPGDHNDITGRHGWLRSRLGF